MVRVSQPFLHFLDVGFFSLTRCGGFVQLVSEFLLEGIAPYVAVDSVCLWEKLSLGASYIIIWD